MLMFDENYDYTFIMIITTVIYPSVLILPIFQAFVKMNIDTYQKIIYINNNGHQATVRFESEANIEYIANIQTFQRKILQS